MSTLILAHVVTLPTYFVKRTLILIDGMICVQVFYAVLLVRETTE